MKHILLILVIVVLSQAFEVIKYDKPGTYLITPDEYKNAESFTIELWSAGSFGLGYNGGGSGGYVKAEIFTNKILEFNLTIGKGDFPHDVSEVIKNFGDHWQVVVDISDEGEPLFGPCEHYEGDISIFCNEKCRGSNIKNTESSITNYLINITLSGGNERIAGELKNNYCKKDHCDIKEYSKGSDAYYCYTDYVPQMYDCQFQINNTNKILHTLHGKGGDSPKGGKGGRTYKHICCLDKINMCNGFSGEDGEQPGGGGGCGWGYHNGFMYQSGKGGDGMAIIYFEPKKDNDLIICNNDCNNQHWMIYYALIISNMIMLLF